VWLCISLGWVVSWSGHLLGWSVACLVIHLVGGFVGFWDGRLVAGFQPRRDDDSTALADFPQRNPVTILLEAGWAPGAVWIGAENLLPTQCFHPQTIQVIASGYTHFMKLEESRYTSTLPPALGQQ